MSLRTEVHAAFDVISPLAGGMAERVVETAQREARTRQRRRRFMLRLRAPIALVAVIVLIAIVAIAVVGSRLITGFGGEHSVSPPHLPSLTELEHRTWQHKQLTADQNCVNEAFAGPVWAYPDDNPPDTAWGIYSNGHFVLAKGVKGLLLVRVRDARSGAGAVFVSANADGDVVGTDTVDGVAVSQHREAVFDTAGSGYTLDGVGNKIFKITMGMKHGFSGCFQWQVDGTYNGLPVSVDSYYYGPPG